MSRRPVESQKIATLLATAAFGADLAALSHMFGPPTFADGDRWAQFDVAGGRFCLASAEEAVAHALLVKVDDIDSAAESAREAGLTVGAKVVGPHEVRQRATTPSGVEVVFYQPLA